MARSGDRIIQVPCAVCGKPVPANRRNQRRWNTETGFGNKRLSRRNPPTHPECRGQKPADG